MWALEHLRCQQPAALFEALVEAGASRDAIEGAVECISLAAAAAMASSADSAADHATVAAAAERVAHGLVGLCYRLPHGADPDFLKVCQ